MSTGHPDPAEIAALGEDLLAADESVAIREHLTDCDSCTSLAADLELLREGLSTLYPMPADIAARIDSALASEAPLVSRETSTLPADHERRARRGRRPQFVLAAAGAIIALGIGGLVVQTMGPSDPSGSDGGAVELAESSADRELADEDSLAVAVRGLLVEAGEADEADEDTVQNDGEFDTESSPESDGSDDDGSGDTSNHGGAQTLTTVPSCISSVIDRAERPLAASEGYLYNGVASYVVVLPHSVDSETVDAYVIDAACADEGSAPGSDDLLIRQSYPR
jgi:hypothetical protein